MSKGFKTTVIICILALFAGLFGTMYYLVTQLNDTNEAPIPSLSTSLKNTSQIDIGDAFLVDIVSETGVKHYIKMDLALGIDNTNKKAFDEVSALLSDSTSLIRDTVIRVTRTQKYEPLAKTDGMDVLEKELLTQLATVLDTDLLVRIYFKEYFVQ